MRCTCLTLFSFYAVPVLLPSLSPATWRITVRPCVKWLKTGSAPRTRLNQPIDILIFNYHPALDQKIIRADWRYFKLRKSRVNCRAGEARYLTPRRVSYDRFRPFEHLYVTRTANGITRFSKYNEFLVKTSSNTVTFFIAIIIGHIDLYPCFVRTITLTNVFYGDYDFSSISGKY
jgi:hypothetical protein